MLWLAKGEPGRESELDFTGYRDAWSANLACSHETAVSREAKSVHLKGESLCTVQKKLHPL